MFFQFVAHPNIQQLMAALWYDGVPGFRRKKAIEKCLIIVRVALLFPFYCALYMIAPNTTTGKVMKKPFMKFLIHASSYLFFLCNISFSLNLIYCFNNVNIILTLLFLCFLARSNFDIGVTAGRVSFGATDRHRRYEESSGGNGETATGKSSNTTRIFARIIRFGLHMGRNTRDIHRGIPEIFKEHVEFHRFY